MFASHTLMVGFTIVFTVTGCTRWFGSPGWSPERLTVTVSRSWRTW